MAACNYPVATSRILFFNSYNVIGIYDTNSNTIVARHDIRTMDHQNPIYKKIWISGTDYFIDDSPAQGTTPATHVLSTDSVYVNSEKLIFGSGDMRTGGIVADYYNLNTDNVIIACKGAGTLSVWAGNPVSHIQTSGNILLPDRHC